MVILIGGTGGTGKTSFARQLQLNYSIPYVCLDHLMMALFRGLDDCGFTPMDDQRKLGEVMWPVIRGFILTNIENEHSIIVEGFQLLPWLVRELETEHPEDVLPLFICLSERYIEENFQTGILVHRNVIEKRGDIDDLSIVGLQQHNRRFSGWCEEANMTCFEIAAPYEAGIAEIHGYVDSRVGVN